MHNSASVPRHDSYIDNSRAASSFVNVSTNFAQAFSKKYFAAYGFVQAKVRTKTRNFPSCRFTIPTLRVSKRVRLRWKGKQAKRNDSCLVQVFKDRV